MFDGTEYASYIALCRELRLEPKGGLLAVGDWYAETAPGATTIDVRLRDPWREVLVDRAVWGGWRWWLPRLDQWLTMLEEAGVEYVEIGVAWVAPEKVVAELVEAGEATKTYYAYDATSRLDTDEKTEFPTREEAAARIWMAVTGKTVPA